MKRPNTITIVTVLALTLATSASLLAYNLLKNHMGKTNQGVPVVSAAADVPVGAKLEASHVKLVYWPRNGLPANYFPNTKSVIGRVVVRPLSTGDIVTEAKLMPLKVTGGIMTYMVPQGHRAVSVAVNEVAGVAGFISPGSRVDVVLTTPRPGAKDDRDNISKIILQNVPVLATGQVTEQKGGKPSTAPTATLDLPPEEAEKLLVGLKRGTLQLLLRNVIDVALTDTKGATVSKALGAEEPQLPAPARKSPGPRKPAAAKLAVAPTPSAKFTVEIIKAGSKSIREFAYE